MAHCQTISNTAPPSFVTRTLFWHDVMFGMSAFLVTMTHPHSHSSEHFEQLRYCRIGGVACFGAFCAIWPRASRWPLFCLTRAKWRVGSSLVPFLTCGASISRVWKQTMNQSHLALAQRFMIFSVVVTIITWTRRTVHFMLVLSIPNTVQDHNRQIRIPRFDCLCVCFATTCFRSNKVLACYA